MFGRPTGPILQLPDGVWEEIADLLECARVHVKYFHRTFCGIFDMAVILLFAPGSEFIRHRPPLILGRDAHFEITEKFIIFFANEGREVSLAAILKLRKSTVNFHFSVSF